MRSTTRRVLSAAISMVSALASFTILTPVANAAELGDTWTDKARYSPNEEVIATSEVSGSGQVRFSLVHLGQVVKSSVIQATGTGEVQWRFNAPANDFTGYMIEVRSDTSASQTALDVSSTWTRFPRFGYLDHYPRGMGAAEQQATINELSRKYHLNALQFYDWMWHHEQPILRDQNNALPEIWQGWNNDTISPRTVEGLIGAAQERNVAALPYSMSYAVREGSMPKNVEASAALKFRSTGSPWKIGLGDSTELTMVDPGNTSWQNHMIAQYKDQINTFKFSGTHIDQLGNQTKRSDGGMVDGANRSVNLPTGFASLVDRTRAETGRPVGLNAVDGFGANQLARSKADYLYTEFWGQQDSFSQVKAYLDKQRRDSNGRSATVAAYVNSNANTGITMEAEAAEFRGRIGIGQAPTNSGSISYADSTGDQGQTITFRVKVPESRKYGIVPRWSNTSGSDARRTLYIDNKEITKIHLFPDANGETWHHNSGTSYQLEAGEHEITLATNNDDYGKVLLDSLTLSSFNTPSVQLADAALAANGASHLELGQDNQMLVNEYFPNETKHMSLELQKWMESYYDVVTAYENLFYGPKLTTLDNTVTIEGQATSRNGQAGTVWTNAMRNDGVDVIHLINLLNSDGKWRNPTPTPKNLTDLKVKYYLSEKELPTEVWMASPDREGGRSTKLRFRSGADENGLYITFQVKELKNWNFIYLKNSDPAQSNPSAEAVQIRTRANKCLDVPGGVFKDGTAIQIWDCANVPSRSWNYQNNKLSAGGKCLDLFANGKTDGTPAHLWTCFDLGSQSWVHTDSGQLYNPQKNKCLDVVGGSTVNGSRTHLWTCHSGESQKWYFPTR